MHSLPMESRGSPVPPGGERGKIAYVSMDPAGPANLYAYTCNYYCSTCKHVCILITAWLTLTSWGYGPWRLC